MVISFRSSLWSFDMLFPHPNHHHRFLLIAAVVWLCTKLACAPPPPLVVWLLLGSTAKMKYVLWSPAAVRKIVAAPTLLVNHYSVWMTQPARSTWWVPWEPFWHMGTGLRLASNLRMLLILVVLVWMPTFVSQLLLFVNKLDTSWYCFSWSCCQSY
jgi:hypothetical protein